MDAVSSTPSSPAIPQPVATALRSASERTGVSFDYLLRTASRESSLDPNAHAPNSSATGLFQFLDQTWLGIIKETGAQFGLGNEASEIERTPNGRYQVSDPTERQRILNLRRDPMINATMGAVFAQTNAQSLSQVLGRQPTSGELYVAHFLGASGASNFLSAANRTPDAPAAGDFPEAANANRTIFFTSDGQARSYADVRDRLIAQHTGATIPSGPATPTMTADAVQPVQQEGPLFHSLFQTGGQTPVSRAVQALWGAAPQGSPILGYASDPNTRQPFFPNSALRVGVANDSTAAPASTETPAPVTASTSVETSPSFGIPIPPTRPMEAPSSAQAIPTTPQSRWQPHRPLDLLAFTRHAGTG